MPENGYYEKRPRPEQRQFLIKYLNARDNVREVIQADEHRLIVSRWSQPDIHVYLSNQYTITVADVIDILEEAPDTTCIVSTMDYARDQEVGLFKSKEFLGAVYYDRDRFLDYLPPERRA
jgi:hypothetical protein